MAHRLLHDSWRSGLKPDHLLRVLQCTRLLSRDNSLRQRFVSMGAVKVCAQLAQLVCMLLNSKCTWQGCAMDQWHGCLGDPSTVLSPMPGNH